MMVARRSFFVSPGKRMFAALVVAAILFWSVAWGPCAAPWQTECFTNGGWGDYKHHYQGWISYLHNSSWMPPTTLAFTWPQVSSVMFTDSIPIIAIIAKPLSKLLHLGNWQYFSLLSLINAVLVAWCSCLLGSLRAWKLWPTLAAGTLLITSSVSWARLQVGHESLQLHGLLLLALVWVVQRNSSVKAWCILCFIAVGIHPYYIPMLLPAALICTMPDKNRRERCITIAALLVSIVISAWVCGFLPGSAGSGSAVWGANLLSLIDPQQHSAIFSALKKREPFEIEGYSYLGMGIALGVLLCLATPPGVSSGQALFPRRWWVVALLLFGLALGPSWAVAHTTLMPGNALCKLPGLCLFYDIFRSAGRFAWPLSYSVLIWVVDQLAVSRRGSLLAILTGLQLADSNLHVLYRQGRDFQVRRWQYSNPANEWLVQHPREAAALRASNLFLMGPMTNKALMPPGFTPQYANPSILSNWGGEGMTRVPQDWIGDKAVAYTLDQLERHKPNILEYMRDGRHVLVMTDDSLLIGRISKLSNNIAFKITRINPSMFAISRSSS